jgi:hypothetical protein
MMWEKRGLSRRHALFQGHASGVPFGNKIIVMPKPFELGIGFTAGEYAFQRLMADDPRAGGSLSKRRGTR